MERQTEAQTVMTGNTCIYDLYVTVGVDANRLLFFFSFTIVFLLSRPEFLS